MEKQDVCIHAALEVYPGVSTLVPGKARCYNCGVWLTAAPPELLAALERMADVADTLAVTLAPVGALAADYMRASTAARAAIRAAKGEPA